MVCNRCGSPDSVTLDPKELNIINIKTLSWRHDMIEHKFHTNNLSGVHKSRLYRLSVTAKI